MHTRRHDKEIKYWDTGNGWTFISASAWKNFFDATIGSIGMLIGPWALKALNSIDNIQPTIMVATFNCNHSTTIISCYSPTNVSEETDLLAWQRDMIMMMKYIWFGVVGFYGISIIVDYSMPKPFYIYVLNIYNMVCFDWYINHYRLYNAESSLFIYIKYIWFVDISQQS